MNEVTDYESGTIRITLPSFPSWNCLTSSVKGAQNLFNYTIPLKASSIWTGRSTRLRKIRICVFYFRSGATVTSLVDRPGWSQTNQDQPEKFAGCSATSGNDNLVTADEIDGFVYERSHYICLRKSIELNSSDFFHISHSLWVLRLGYHIWEQHSMAEW